MCLFFFTVFSFPVIDISSHGIVVREDAWYDFNFLKLTKVWFVTQDVVYPGECSMCTWEECVFFCIWMKSPEDIKVSSNVSFKTCFSLVILFWWSVRWCEWGVKVSYYYCVTVSFSFNISPSNEHPGLISFRVDWLDLLAVQGTLKSLLQHHSSKTSILQCSAFFMAQ